MKNYQFCAIMAALAWISLLVCSGSPKLAGGFGHFICVWWHALFAGAAVYNFFRNK